jgi:hypothetical protein
MARQKRPTETKVESICYKDKRTNISTEELRDFTADDEHAPMTMLCTLEPRKQDTGAGNIFALFGEPDVEIKKMRKELTVEITCVDVYDPTTDQIRNSRTTTSPAGSSTPITTARACLSARLSSPVPMSRTKGSSGR